jgi:hypothetical protein
MLIASIRAAIVAGSFFPSIDNQIYDALPEDLQDLCVSVRDGVYRIEAPEPEKLDDLLESFGIDWDPDASAARMSADKAAFPLKDIECSDADVLIDLDQLSIRNNKRVPAASLFADIAGFTRYIDDAQTNDEKQRGRCAYCMPSARRWRRSSKRILADLVCRPRRPRTRFISSAERRRGQNREEGG